MQAIITKNLTLSAKVSSLQVGLRAENIGIRASPLLPMGCREPARTSDEMVGETIEVGSPIL